MARKTLTDKSVLALKPRDKRMHSLILNCLGTIFESHRLVAEHLSQ